MKRSIDALAAVVLSGVALSGCAVNGQTIPVASNPVAQCRWVPSWASAQMEATGDNRLADEALAGATLRQIVHLSAPGQRVRVRLSNAFGTEALHLDGASVAKSADIKSARIAGNAYRLSFGGLPDITIPMGAEVLSDPVALPVDAFADLAISIEYDDPPEHQTSHPGSRAGSWLLKGDHAAAADLPGAERFERWYNIAGVEVEHCDAEQVPVIVALGDSITDGNGVTIDANTRWTDFLARRLQGRAAILNAGIGGNRILADGLGPNALRRMDRDVLAQPGVTHLIVLEGVNDIGGLSRKEDATPEEHAALVRQLKQAFTQIAARAQARGIKVYGATIMPFAGSDYYHATPASEGDRQEVNAWIRTSGVFDAVIDLDAATRDPARPSYLDPRYDKGDGLHPGPVGYEAMAAAIPLELFD